MPGEFDHAAAQSAFMEHVDAQEAAEPDAEEVAAEIADAPEVEDVPVPDPELPAAEGVVADPYEQYGGEDVVKNAMIVANALKTEEGIRQLTARGLQTLGYNSQDVQAFLARQAAGNVGVAEQEAVTEAALFAGREDDDLLTVAEARAFQESIQEQIAAAKSEALTPFLEQQAEANRAAVTYNVDQALIRAIGDPTAENPISTVDPVQADVILRVANSLAESEGVEATPQTAGDFIQRAHALVVQAAGEKRAAHLAGKRAAKEALPTKIGGQGAGADAPREPQNTREADLAFFALMDLPAPPR